MRFFIFSAACALAGLAAGTTAFAKSNEFKTKYVAYIGVDATHGVIRGCREAEPVLKDQMITASEDLGVAAADLRLQTRAVRQCRSRDSWNCTYRCVLFAKSKDERFGFRDAAEPARKGKDRLDQCSRDLTELRTNSHVFNAMVEEYMPFPFVRRCAATGIEIGAR
jgi:hypothetical protein